MKALLFLPLLALISSVAAAQSVAPTYRDATGQIQQAGGTLSFGVQETFSLVTANVASASTVIYGGDYVLSQTCAGYGTLTLQYLGPDGSTYLTLATYTTTDTGSGHGFTLGSYARVRVTIAGTTGCNALFSRVPS